MRQKSITASELAAKMATDAEYQKRRQIKDEAMAALSELCSADERGLVSEIRDFGYDIDSVWDFVNNTPHPFLPRPFIGTYSNAYPVLVKHLGIPHHVRVREGIIRALTVKDGGIQVEESLISQFRHEQDPMLKWALANALKAAMPYSRRRKLPEIDETFSKGMTHNKAVER